MENRPGGERPGGEAPRPEQPGPGDARSGDEAPRPERPDPGDALPGGERPGGARGTGGDGGPAGPVRGQRPPEHPHGPHTQSAQPPPRGQAPPWGRPPSWGQAPAAGSDRVPRPGPYGQAGQYRTPGYGMPGPQYSPGVPAFPHRPAPQGHPGAYGAQAVGAPVPRAVPHAPAHTVQPGAYPGTGWQQQPGPPWGHPHAAARPRRRGLRVLVGSSVAAVIALVALAASILMVATTPREEPPPNGTDLSAHYDDRLAARPNEVEVDLVDHPLYDAAIPEEINCGTPELDMGSDESWEEFATAAGLCLDELWAPTMEEMGLSVESLEFAVTQDSPDADGAEGYTLAYYESDLARITVVLPNVRHMGAQIPAQHREDVWLALMGHEYGHHVQYVTGILNISHDLRWNAGSEEDELDTLRRTELQAECMAGVGLRGITGADEETLAAVNANFNSGGDLDTHGSASNRAFWLERGWSEPTMSSCNTYGADPGQVT